MAENVCYYNITCYEIADEFIVCTGRQNGIGLNSVFARVAGILAPLIRLLDVYHYTIPMLIYGIAPIAAAGLCLLLPETLNVELQDHTELMWVDKPFQNWVLISLTGRSKQFYILIFFFLISENLWRGPLRKKKNQERAQKCNLYAHNGLPALNW